MNAKDRDDKRKIRSETTRVLMRAFASEKVRLSIEQARAAFRGFREAVRRAHAAITDFQEGTEQAHAAVVRSSANEDHDEGTDRSRRSR